MVYFIIILSVSARFDKDFLNNSVSKLVHMNRKRTDILDVGEPTLRRRRTDGRRNDRLPDNKVNSFMLPFRLKMHKAFPKRQSQMLAKTNFDFKTHTKKSDLEKKK